MIIFIGTPLHLLETGHTLVIDDIRISPFQTGRFEGPVEVDNHVVLGGRGGYLLVELHDKLVVTIHKIDLEALDAHLGIVLEYALNVLVDSLVAGPKDEPYIL